MLTAELGLAAWPVLRILVALIVSLATLVLILILGIVLVAHDDGDGRGSAVPWRIDLEEEDEWDGPHRPRGDPP